MKEPFVAETAEGLWGFEFRNGVVMPREVMEMGYLQARIYFEVRWRQIRGAHTDDGYLAPVLGMPMAEVRAAIQQLIENRYMERRPDQTVWIPGGLSEEWFQQWTGI